MAKGSNKGRKNKKTTVKKGNSSASQYGEKFISFLKSEDFRKICGVFLILFSVFLLVAMVSFYISGEGNNWFGTLGEALAALFSKSTFGVAAVGFCFLFFLYGLRLVNVSILPLAATSLITLFWMAWLSCSLGYVNHLIVNKGNPDIVPWVGTFGYFSAEGLCGAIRGFTPILLVALACIFLVFVHHVKVPEWKKQQTEEEKKAEDWDPVVVDVPKKQSIWQRLFPAKEPRKKQEEEEGADYESEKPFVTDTTPEETATTPDEEPAKKNRPKVAAVADVPFVIEGDNVAAINPTDDTPTAENNKNEVIFDIDDQFARVNARARGEEVGDPSTKKTNDPTFTIVDNNPEGNAGADAIENPLEETPEEDTRKHFTLDSEYDPHLDYPHYQMPSIDLLEDWETRNVKVTQEELIANKDRIVETLRNYGIEIVDIKAAPGPTVTLYEIKPAPGIRIAKIKGLEDDIALSLSALGIRIIAPLPGKGTIGIEVPNSNPQIVSMKTMLASDAFQKNTKYELPVALGKTISNEPYVTDLAKMPHLLMAGATGTGKSVGLNAVIASLLYKKHPSELKLIMVDPKKVELSLYSKIDRHYLAKMPDSDDAIITDVKKVVRTLNSLCIEMDNRYDLLKAAQVRKITEYNAKFKARQLNPANGHRFLPYIVLIIDEFADLIMTAGKEVEMPIARLAQLARAVGIHLIVATQRPTTSIITGNIKTNFPGRIAFRVTSVIDSRVILDTGGANQLIGRGDMLISLAGSDMVRLQCALIETEEIERLVNFIGDQETTSEGFILPEYLDENEEPNKDFDPKQKDEYFNDAARLVVAAQFGSTSLLQRKLQLGYNRAGRVIDQLEAAGIVGAHNGSKPREVLIHDEVELEQLLKSL